MTRILYVIFLIAFLVVATPFVIVKSLIRRIEKWIV